MLARLGFAARGILYITVALLLLEARREEDISGALVLLGQGAGRWVLALVAAGFAGYGLWRLSDGVFNIERHEADRRGHSERLGAVGSGLAYLFLAGQALWLLTHSLHSAEVGDSAREGARAMLHLPGGALAVIAAGAVLITVGFAQFAVAFTCRFCRGLDPAIADHPLIRLLGRLGYAARGVVFLVSGFFIGKAGLAARASEAGGMEETLDWLASPWDLLVAAGLLAFGIFCLLEARFRHIHDIPVERAKRAVQDKLATS